MEREKYTKYIKEIKNSKSCEHKKAKNVLDFPKDSSDNANKLVHFIGDKFNQCSGSEWLLGFHLYVNNIMGKSVGRFHQQYGFSRGTIIEYDGFGDIGTEQNKNRPAVVLLENGKDGVIIAPIGRGAYKSGKHYHVDLEKNIKDQGNMRENCGIKLDQIRYIDKNRITGKFGKITNTDKLNEIDEKLTRNLAKRFIEKIEKENERLNEEIKKVTKQISYKEEEISMLKKRIRLLELELNDKELNIEKNNIS